MILMELFERVEQVLWHNKMPRYALAKKLGVAQNTFTRYFCMEQQAKLSQYLWDIHALFPDIRREWLFFGEGEMLDSGQPFAEVNGSGTEALKNRVAELEAELREERHLNRQLTTRLLVDGVGDKGAVNNTGKAGEGAG